MTWKGDAKFKGKLTRNSKTDIRNLVNFHTSSQKSGNFHFNRFCPKHIKIYMKKYQRVMSHDTEE